MTKQNKAIILNPTIKNPYLQKEVDPPPEMSYKIIGKYSKGKLKKNK